ncbi:MAG: MBL fold metallo-hydrolase [Acidobacteriota bacterium]|nr:MBL fold metallo-hydrolase [Acidobacteriota bacterium]
MRLFLFMLIAVTGGYRAHAQDVTLHWLANEGALLKSESYAVLIDAFVIEPYSIYAALSPQTWLDMLDGKPPFEKIDVALVSHRHRDHFQPGAAVAFLKRHAETTLLASGDVWRELSQQSDFESIRGRVEKILPEPGKLKTWARGGLKVELMRIAHGGQHWRNLHNLAHVIHLGGKVLHIGDASGAIQHYKPYARQLAEIDIALIPYWFYSDSGEKVLAEVMTARHEVAVHIPPEALAEVTEKRGKSHPHLVIYGKEGEARRF